ncbi:MAG: transposase [Candidatus Thermoplasmatota archaeon]|jgi:transposase-like protein|nr:transposase [Candidatus Thermoplasmatota archaeon]MCL5788995.1 transposase [Candidatus Thermoplasmatota archaeon]
MASIIATVRDGLKKIGIPIIAVISDHHHSIRLGVKKALPGIRHQFCHFHVLRNACLPIVDTDRKLKKEIRKR